jgi:integrase
MRAQHGTLTKKSGKWLGHYSRWITDADGNKTRMQKAFAIGSVADLTKSAARRLLLVRIEQELGLKADSRVTVQWFVEHRWQPLHEGSWRESTRATNLWVLSHIVKRFGTTAIENVDSVALQVWLNHLAKSHSGSLVRHVRIFLKSIFVEAVEQDFVRKSPARLLRIPQLKPVVKPFLTREQIQALLSHAKGMDRVLLRLLLVTALRPSELFALYWAAFKPKKKLLKIAQSVYRGKLRDYTKTTDASSRQELLVVFLPDVIVQDLLQWAKDTPYKGDDRPIFPDKWGDLWWKENYQQRRLNPLAKAAGIPRVNYQILRRSTATHAQGLGSPKDIAAILRHRTPDTAALHYTQQQDESVRDTAEKLAEMLETKG